MRKEIHRIKECFVLVLLFFFGEGTSQGQPVANSLIPAVDRRVELVSIVFRLADPANFKDSISTPYTKDIDRHFDRYAKHSLINYIRSILDSLASRRAAFGYWEIPGLAVHLSEPPLLQPLVAEGAGADDYDKWDRRSLLQPKLLDLLRRFYRDADCESFFRSQQDYYNRVQSEYERQGIPLNRQWFADFFGLPATEQYYAIIGLNLRNGAYLRVNFKNNRRNTFTVFGCPGFDERGLPVGFADPMFPRAMLHEYIHAFTNQLVDASENELRPSAELLLKDTAVKSLVQYTFYGNWRYLLYESLVRACSILYLADNTSIETTADAEIEEEEKAGFLWMRPLVELLGSYERGRAKYRDLAVFLPEIEKFFKQQAADRHKDS